MTEQEIIQEIRRRITEHTETMHSVYYNHKAVREERIIIDTLKALLQHIEDRTDEEENFDLWLSRREEDDGYTDEDHYGDEQVISIPTEWRERRR